MAFFEKPRPELGVGQQYGVNAIPTLLIIGRDGVIREHFVGSRTEETLRSAIASAVGSAN